MSLATDLIFDLDDTDNVNNRGSYSSTEQNEGSYLQGCDSSSSIKGNKRTRMVDGENLHRDPNSSPKLVKKDSIGRLSNLNGSVILSGRNLLKVSSSSLNDSGKKTILTPRSKTILNESFGALLATTAENSQNIKGSEPIDVKKPDGAIRYKIPPFLVPKEAQDSPEKNIFSKSFNNFSTHQSQHNSPNGPLTARSLSRQKAYLQEQNTIEKHHIVIKSDEKNSYNSDHKKEIQENNVKTIDAILEDDMKKDFDADSDNFALAEIVNDAYDADTIKDYLSTIDETDNKSTVDDYLSCGDDDSFIKSPSDDSKQKSNSQLSNMLVINSAPNKLERNEKQSKNVRMTFKEMKEKKESAVNGLNMFSSETISNGAFSKIHVSRTKNGNNLIVKEFFRENANEKKDVFYSHYTNERNILSKVNHPFIRQTKGFLEMDNHYFIFLEYIKGPDLLEFIMYNRILDLNLTKFYIIQIAMALEYLHSLNIVYIDLKPENIVIDESGYLKLIDFGFSFNCCANEYIERKIGTETYMAPETLYECKISHKSDVWQLGTMIYIMLTGVSLYPDYYKQYKNKCELFGDIMFELMNNKTMDLATKVLLDKILKLEAKERPTVAEILKDVWFKNFNINKIYEKTIKPLWKPILTYSKENDEFCTKMYRKISEKHHYKLLDLFWNQNQPFTTETGSC